ncbi:hypothetical protein [[Acidovorax] ebreus]|uniref:hypothetical protein n=1 Tax=Diaphorobacter sp. LI3 TaxID=2952886 RepID=UPI0020664555|nr:hypothetical protein MRB47_14950 [Diaphorobacter sp. LI3]
MGLLLLIEMFVAVFGLVFKVIGGVLLMILKVAFVLVRGMLMLRIPLMADSDSIPIADSVPGDGGHVARVS